MDDTKFFEALLLLSPKLRSSPRLQKAIHKKLVVVFVNLETAGGYWTNVTKVPYGRD